MAFIQKDKIWSDNVLKSKLIAKAEQEKILRKTESVIKKLKESAKGCKVSVDIMLGGSAAKGTFLKDDFDCDIFVRFASDSQNKIPISDSLQKIVEHAQLPFQRVHGSRDYFQTTIQGINYEIIPVLHVTNPKLAQNVTDMSPLHVAWIKKRLTEQLRKEIILTKIFCKAQRVYGAESYINGFSGHVIDILIAHYGSFESLLKHAVQWKEKEVIDVEQYYKGKNALRELNSAKIVSPLIIIDPISPERNAAAALSTDKWLKFKKAANAYLKKPSIQFFEREEIKKESLKKQAKEQTAKTFLWFEAMPLDGKEDIVGTKVLKVYEHIATHLALHDFTILESDWVFRKKKSAYLWYMIKEDVLFPTKEHMGPPLTAKSACEAFKKKHKETYVKEKRLYATIKRAYTKPQDFAKAVIKEEYVTTRVQKITHSSYN